MDLVLVLVLVAVVIVRSSDSKVIAGSGSPKVVNKVAKSRRRKVMLVDPNSVEVGINANAFVDRRAFYYFYDTYVKEKNV